MGLLIHKQTVVSGTGLLKATGLEDTSNDHVATAAMTAELKAIADSKADSSDLGGVRMRVTEAGILQIIYDDGTTADVPTEPTDTSETIPDT